jgi:kinesin family protein 11
VLLLASIWGPESLWQVENALKAMGSLVNTIIRDAREYVDSERESVLQAKALASTAANAEVSRLREQNAHLTKLLESEKIKAEKAKDELIQRVSGLLGEFTSARDRSLREVVSQVQAGNAKAETQMLQFGTKHGEVMDGMVARGRDSTVSMERRGTEGKRTRDGALKVSSSSLPHDNYMLILFHDRR